MTTATTDTSNGTGADTDTDTGQRDSERIALVDLQDRNALAERNLHLVDHVVNQLAAGFPRHVDRDELKGAGAAGLVDAAHRYDPSTGVPFARYASIRIRGAVLDATRTRDWATRRLRRDLRAIEHATSDLEDRLRRTPDDTEVAAELGIEVDTVRERRAAALTSTLLTLDRPVGEQHGDTDLLGDRIVEQDQTWLPEAAFEHRELVGTLRTAIAHLPELPRRVLVEHHFEGRLLKEIADDLGVRGPRLAAAARGAPRPPGLLRYRLRRGPRGPRPRPRQAPPRGLRRPGLGRQHLAHPPGPDGAGHPGPGRRGRRLREHGCLMGSP